MNLKAGIQDYFQNMKRILNSYNNPLKKIENIPRKNQLESSFYDNIAEPHLKNFDETLFLYDENEEFPVSHHYFYSKLEKVQNKRILDCCCGYGFTAVKCAKRQAIVSGIDISAKMIELAQKNVDFNNVSDTVNLQVMSVENMAFENNTFDYVVGIGALHHLNLELAGKEMARVLKPGGKVLFIEPRIPFKWLIFMRSLLPNKCYESPGGSQLTDQDIQHFANNFSMAQQKYFILFKKFARLPIIRRYSKQLDNIDAQLIHKFPFLKKICWAFVLEFTK